MRIRRFWILILVAAAAGLVSFFSMREAVGQSVAASGRGLVQLIGVLTHTAAALAGEPSSPSPSLPPVVSGFDWSTVAVVSGFIAVFALYFSLHQLASLYDERA